jgi:hypothetical protein
MSFCKKIEKFNFWTIFANFRHIFECHNLFDIWYLIFSEYMVWVSKTSFFVLALLGQQVPQLDVANKVHELGSICRRQCCCSHYKPKNLTWHNQTRSQKGELGCGKLADNNIIYIWKVSKTIKTWIISYILTFKKIHIITLFNGKNMIFWKKVSKS